MSDQTQAPEIQHQQNVAVTPQEAQLQAATIDVAPSEQPLEAAVVTAPNAAQPIAAVSAPAREPMPEINAGLTPSQVEPSACGCGGGSQPALVYAIGTLGYDFGTEARRDSLVGQIKLEPGQSFDQAFLDHINVEDNQEESAAVTWTINQDATAIYAVQPAGAYAERTYKQLRTILGGQMDEEERVERVSFPGYVTTGKATLLSGQTVPVLVPELRGMASWSVTALLKACGTDTKDDTVKDAVREFLNRIYYQLRNLGLTSADRAINFSATQGFLAFQVFSQARKQKLQLDTITVEQSPICRPDSDCQDVKLSFFDPDNTNKANFVFRFAVDVSDVIPVLVDEVRTFTERP